MNQKAAFEAIAPSFGNSFAYQKIDQYNENGNRGWHYHPELELVYVNGGSGKRQIGSHVSYFRQGDLILIGSNLPHCGFTDKLTGNKSETLVQMKLDFLGSDFFDIPEMRNIQKLFEVAKGGNGFSGKTKLKVGGKNGDLGIPDRFSKIAVHFEHPEPIGHFPGNATLERRGFFHGDRSEGQ